MPRRVIALFLGFLVFWSSLGSIEATHILAQPLGDGTGQALVESAQPARGQPPAFQQGSVEDHHLDDLPSQFQGDSHTDTPFPPPSSDKAQPPALAMPRAQLHRSLSLPAPFLAGPLRPPCGEPARAA